MSEGASGQMGSVPSVPRGDYHPNEDPSVQQVLQSLERLEEAPVAEHARIFEETHDRLRDALADAGDGDPGS